MSDLYTATNKQVSDAIREMKAVCGGGQLTRDQDWQLLLLIQAAEEFLTRRGRFRMVPKPKAKPHRARAQ